MFADYFGRNATAAAQLLKNYDDAAFQEKLRACNPAIAWDGRAWRSHEGRATLDMLVRLVARLYPTITLLPLNDVARPGLDRLEALAKSINPKITIRHSQSRLTTAIVVGSTPSPARAIRALYVGSEGWIVKLSRAHPVSSGMSRNVFGAGIGACLAAANLFREVFADELGNPPLDDELVFSVLDANTRSHELANNPLPANIDVGVVHLVGLGAIGNAIVWALKSAPVNGTFHAIDHQKIDLGNLQRYVMALRADEGMAKSDLAARELKGRGRRVEPHEKQCVSFPAA